MDHYWEFQVLTGLAALALAMLLGALIHAWVADWLRWRHVPRHTGSTYDASAKDYRPNVDLRRVR